MGLESLLALAYRRGCGISRKDALRSIRYQALVTAAPHIPHVSRQESAEMTYLGERLADIAFTTLPHDLQQHAFAWQTYTSAERHAALDTLVRRLNYAEWKQSRPGRRVRGIVEVLPYERGEWHDSTIMPNCLGLAQVLIGFARAAGSEHMMIDVLANRSSVLNRRRIDDMSRMLRLLTPLSAEPTARNVIGRIRRARKRVIRAELLNDELRRAHHALALKVDDEWWGVDPYFGVKFRFYPSARRMSNTRNFIERHPNRHALAIDMYRELKCHERMTTAFEAVVSAMHRFDEPIDAWGLNEVCHKVALARLMTDESWTNGGKHSTDEIVRVLGQVWTAALTPVDRRADSAYEITEATIASSQSSRDRRNQALKRLLNYTWLLYLLAGNDVIDDTSAGHALMQLVDPSYHLGVSTVAHLAHMTDRPGRELLRFSNSQWILHDTIGEVTATTEPALQRVLKTRIRRLSTLEPHYVMPDLRAHLAERKQA